MSANPPDRPFGSLTETIRRAEAEVASWSPAKREFARRATAPRTVEDPCRSPRRCDEAQTCVGGCTHYNRTGATIEQICAAVERSETTVKKLIYPNTRAAQRARGLRSYHRNKHRWAR